MQPTNANADYETSTSALAGREQEQEATIPKREKKEGRFGLGGLT